MTNGQPEPFGMPTGGDDADESTDDPWDDTGTPDDEPWDAADSESIADLIDEASRTAAEQAVQEATGSAPRDRSSEVWGAAEDEQGLDDVWAAAADRHAGRHVFDTVLGDDDAAWEQTTDRMPAAAADPARDPSGDSDEHEPDVFLFAIDDPHDDDAAGHDDAAGAATDIGTHPDEDAGTDHDEPDPFRFAAGPATTAPAEVPDHVTTDDEPEPETFAFAVDPTPDPPTPAASADPPADDPSVPVGDVAGEQPVDDLLEPLLPGGEDAEPDEAGDEGWQDDIGVAGDVGSDDAADPEPTAEPVLAESATPRSDAGWEDLEDERASWSLPGMPRSGGPDGDEEPERFTMSLDEPAGQPDDHPDDQPAPTGTDGAPTAASDDLQDALEDLVDHGDATAGDDPTPDPAVGGLDDLDDPMAALDQFDDLDAAAVGGSVTDGPDEAAADEADTDEADAADEADTDDADEVDDAPPPSTPPPGLTFSSSKPRKRGLFGR